MNTHTIIDKQDVKAVNTGAKAQGNLYAAHQKVFPKRAEGAFRKLKWIIMAVTLGIYYLTPWIRWDRGPHAPDQAVLLDMANRRFYFFFIEIWPQEFYFVAGLLVMAGVGLFLITSVVGRAWCGYSCPQTVWTDLFIKVEELIQGDRNARIKLDKAPWSLRKLALVSFTHLIWILIAVATGGAWIFYFADAPTLFWNFITLKAPFVAYGTVAVLTATTYLLGGIMREQVCIYMCPWPRIQAAMLDEDSLVVTYNDWRGEPRSAGTKKAAAAGLAVGDCIDCNACVAVCPTGIDIRNGTQMECVNCTACIDACDAIMTKIHRPLGLIRYASLNAIEQGQSFRFTPRLAGYTAVLAALAIALGALVWTRSDVETLLLRAPGALFQNVANGQIQNIYTLKLVNKTARELPIELKLENVPGTLKIMSGGVLTVPRQELAQSSVLIQLDPAHLKGANTPIRIGVYSKGRLIETIKTVFVGPRP